jgi:hypothetical protein
MTKKRILIRARSPEEAQRQTVRLVKRYHRLGQQTHGYVQPWGRSPDRWLVIISIRGKAREPARRERLLAYA